MGGNSGSTGSMEYDILNGRYSVTSVISGVIIFDLGLVLLYNVFMFLNKENDMSFVFWFIVSYIAFTYITWFMYLAVMNLIEQKENLTWESKIFAYPLAAIGVTLDFLYNVVYGSVMFLEPPKEWLLTKRLNRHIEENGSSWRGKLATWFCTHLLDPFDSKGHHCRKKK
jgi:hypothetical protein